MNVHEVPRPRRPHARVATDTIRVLLHRAGEQARRYARTGPKESEDICHLLADEYLDELQHRGALRPRNEEA